MLDKTEIATRSIILLSLGFLVGISIIDRLNPEPDPTPCECWIEHEVDLGKNGNRYFYQMGPSKYEPGDYIYEGLVEKYKVVEKPK